MLVVEDEAHLRQVIELYLNKEGFEVLHAADGQEALQIFSARRPDLVILDLMLPKVDGWEVCRSLRRASQVPIIIVTARDEEVDRIVGLELGADDYVVKPFSPRELVARVKAVLRRGPEHPVPEQGALHFPGLSIDQPRHEVRVGDELVYLTPTEFRLLWYLASHQGKVCTREELLERVWGYESASDARTVDVHIKRIRRKLASGRQERFTITTVWGLGYKFEVT